MVRAPNLGDWDLCLSSLHLGQQLFFSVEIWKLFCVHFETDFGSPESALRLTFRGHRWPQSITARQGPSIPSGQVVCKEI